MEQDLKVFLSRIVSIKGAVNSTAELLPLFTVGLILLGTYNVSRFYFWFDVNIFNYLDPSEILFSFTNLLTVLFGFGAVLSINYIIVIYFLSPSLRKFAQIVFERSQPITRKKVKFIFFSIFFLLNGSLIVLYWSFMAFSDFWSNQPEVHFDTTLVWAIGFDCLLFAYMMILFRDGSMNFKAQRRRFYVSLILSFLVLLILYFEGRNRLRWWYLVKKGYPKYEVALTMNNDSRIQTNENLVYISSTRNYHFFKNTVSKSTVIIPVSEVKQMHIRELRKGI